MAQSNHERVGRALELLNLGLRPFVERELQAVHKDAWREAAEQSQRTIRGPSRRDRAEPAWDTQALLAILGDQWNVVFKNVLAASHRSLVNELRDVRDDWDHQAAFSADDTYRALDSIHRLLSAISAEEAQEVERSKHELLRLRFEDQARKETRRAATTPLEGQPVAGLKPWREVVTPHPDVASGRYVQAEFAANLGQVHRNEGVDEYRDPAEFFRRTFLTDGLRRLLVNALRRLGGTGGDPVIELQTNFGGGKTHSMLALYHLFSGVAPAELPGIESVLQEAGVARPPKTRWAVLVGQDIQPGKTHPKPDGVVVHTLWGELAWQLLRQDGYACVAEADRTGTNPGAGLRELFRRAAPCLILIDEWLAFVRQLFGCYGLPAGSFEANMTFAQALTEAAMAVPGTMVVASLPASDVEIGGHGGQEALVRLKNVFGRTEAPWRPASADEGFEIVRRRLFQPIADPALFAARDAVVHRFAEMYRTQAAEFPPYCREAEYTRRLQAAYPIHPELFDRLYNDWSSLEKFQRTRGVLRLMAAVIHTLWEQQDASLLILPATVPVAAVQYELTRHLEDTWAPVLEADVDGPNSLPLRLDRGNPNLGRYSAARRVARTLYLGSAPTFRSPNKGVEDRQVRLGCAQPGESVATFGDALRRLTDQATHLYVDGRRYWYSPQPSVTRLAQGRAGQQDADTVAEEIKRRLRDEAKDRGRRGDFHRVHAAPAASGDVPDEPEVRLVILGPEVPHTARQDDSPARRIAAEFLAHKGTGDRSYANALVFLAPDRARGAELEQAVRQYLAWKSIAAESEGNPPVLELDAFQKRQVTTKLEQADDTVRQRIPETYHWLLVPGQGWLQENPPDGPPGVGPVEWQEIRLQGGDSLAVRAAKKLRNDGLLITTYGPTLLRAEMDRVPLWRGEHVRVKQLAEDFSRYLYLPRLRDSAVLRQAIEKGVALPNWRDEGFACAEGFDAARGGYTGLRAGETLTLPADGDEVVVQPAAAIRQLAAGQPRTKELPGDGTDRVTEPQTGTAKGENSCGEKPGEKEKMAAERTTAKPAEWRRFHGSVRLSAARLGRDAGQIATEVVQHLAGLVDAEVEVTLEIHARLPGGVPEPVVRTVTENCQTLRFREHGFEEQ